MSSGQSEKVLELSRQLQIFDIDDKSVILCGTGAMLAEITKNLLLCGIHNIAIASDDEILLRDYAEVVRWLV
jgi:molybdopterin/thiamine biosynthesis adenylyltransferase